MSKGKHIERGIIKRGEDGVDDKVLEYLANAQETLVRQPGTEVAANTSGRFRRIADFIGINFLTQEEERS